MLTRIYIFGCCGRVLSGRRNGGLVKDMSGGNDHILRENSTTLAGSLHLTSIELGSQEKPMSSDCFEVLTCS